jgi:hypothetical protein
MESVSSNQDLNQLQQDLQAGNLSTARQAYAALQQDAQQFAAPAIASTTSSAFNNLSIQG